MGTITYRQVPKSAEKLLSAGETAYYALQKEIVPSS